MKTIVANLALLASAAASIYLAFEIGDVGYANASVPMWAAFIAALASFAWSFPAALKADRPLN